MAAVSNEYKDRLFSFLFGAEENRTWTLSLYNPNMPLRDLPLAQAIGYAIDAMPLDYEIKSFLTVHRAEVLGMLLTEYNEEEAMELFRRDGIEEGMEIGMEKGRLETLVSLVKDRFLTVKEAAARCNMSVEAFQKLLTSYSAK